MNRRAAGLVISRVTPLAALASRVRHKQNPKSAKTTGTGIRLAWLVIEGCPHRNPDDGCCDHVDAATPECHGVVCPLTKEGRSMNETLTWLNGGTR